MSPQRVTRSHRFMEHDCVVRDDGLGEVVFLFEIEVDLQRHGRFRYVRPLHAGEWINRTTTIEEITSRVGNDFLTTRTDMVAEDGELVVTAWLMFVVRGE